MNAKMNPDKTAATDSSQTPHQRVVATLTNFPCGTNAARKHIRHSFRNSKDARTTITNFQRSNSLHSMFAKSFDTTPVHESALRAKSDSNNKRHQMTNGKSEAASAVEPLDPSPVLEFLSHLGVTRHEVHSRVASALRSAIEDEIQRVPLPPHSSEGTSNSSSKSSLSCMATTTGEAGHESLLNLLKSVWHFRDVPELRPVLVCLLKRLGDHTPVQILRRLGAKNNKKGETSDLKNSELMSQLGIAMRRLVWEADWIVKWETSMKEDGEEASSCQDEVALRGSTILADMVRPLVEGYVSDPMFVHAADLAFVGTLHERRLATKLRRTAHTSSDGGQALTGESTSNRVTLAAIGATKPTNSNGPHFKPPNSGNNQEGKRGPSSAVAIARIKETIGNRPKLLGAVLDMLISEYAITGCGVSNLRTLSNEKKKEAIARNDPLLGSILGGATNLLCPLVADVLLSFGHLPRSYEALGIMARILDGSVQSGSISDSVVAQVQGCLRTIFRPSQLGHPQHNELVTNSDGPMDASVPSLSSKNSGAKQNLSSKQNQKQTGNRGEDKPKPAKDSSSIHAGLSGNDSDYEHKLLQRVVKAAINAMRENDPQNLFLNPVTDAIAPGYSSVIKTPMCLRTMEEKMMNVCYKKIKEFEEDTILMFSNCVKYNVGPTGQWFRSEATRQKKLWREKILPDAKAKLKADLAKRRKALAQAKAAETNESSGSKKRKAPPPLAFAPPEKADKANGVTTVNNFVKETNDDAAINNLTSKDVDPLPPWRAKRLKKDVDFPSMTCLAAMLLADPFVMRILLDKILRILRIDIIKGKEVPAAHPILPSLLQILNIAQSSMHMCALRGKHLFIPSAGIESGTDNDVELNSSYASLRDFVPLFTKLLLDSELDRRMAIGGDLHDAALQALLARSELQIEEWREADSQHALRGIVEGAFISLLRPGNTNEIALRDQLPRFVAALNKLSGGNMLNERPFFMSLTHCLARYKSKLAHSTRDLVTSCMINWLKMGENISAKVAMSSSLHECFMHLLNEWSLLGNIVLPRDLFLSLAEEAVAAAGRVEVGSKCKLFLKLWGKDDNAFAPIKLQYERMLSSTPDAKALQWREKVGIKALTS